MRLDEKGTRIREEKAAEIFSGILGMRMEGHFPRFTPWSRIVEWRGAQAALMELVTRPGFMHRLMRLTTDAFLARLDQL